MSLKLRCLLFLALCALLPVLVFAAGADGPPWGPAGKLLAGDGSNDDNFGWALDIDGDTAAVGALGWNNTGNDYQGAAYVFTRDAAGWTERAKLLRDDGSVYEAFGSDVALDDGTLAVGMFGKNRPASPIPVIDAGAVYVYTGAGTTWTEQAALMPDDLVESNRLGTAVALDGDTLIGGAPSIDGAENEAAYVFRRAGTTWALEEKLTPPDNLLDRNFGIDVALAGDVALVGAPRTPGDGSTFLDTGVVYVFSRSGSDWSPAGVLLPDDGQTGGAFGYAVAFDGQTAVVVSREDDGSNEGLPRAYIYTFNHDGGGLSWSQTAKLAPALDEGNFSLGDAAVHGDRIILGSADAPAGENSWPGAAFIYERAGGVWTQTQTLRAADAQSNDRFGSSVALAADAALVGAPEKAHLNDEEQGAVYAFAPAIEAAHMLYLPVSIGRPAPPAPADLIVYVDEVNSEPDIFTIHAGGTGKTNLTQSPAREYWPRWSPDRQLIVFTRFIPSSVGELMIMNADGSGQQAIPTPGLDAAGEPAWSPDGTKIAFSGYTQSEAWDIYVIGVDGSGLTNLTPDLSGVKSGPAWSPDGTRIVFSRYDDNDPDVKKDLYVMNADGSGKVVLPSDVFYRYSPDWSPDGASILFTGNRGDGSGTSIYVMPAAGGPAQKLIDNAEGGRWSADGGAILFGGGQAPVGSGGIFRADADGGNVAPVDASPTATAGDW